MTELQRFLRAYYRALASTERLWRLRGFMDRIHHGLPQRPWEDFRASVNWLGREISHEFSAHPTKQL